MSDDGCGGVLIVEDDADIRRAIAQVIADEGYAVRTAGDGRAALDVLRAPGALLPCVVILDLMMPVMDGWTFRAEQQSDTALAHIPVVILTADGGGPQKAAALDADGVLRKPIDLSLLLDTLERYL